MVVMCCCVCLYYVISILVIFDLLKVHVLKVELVCVVVNHRIWRECEV